MVEYTVKNPSSDEILELAHITYEARQDSTLADDNLTLERVTEHVAEVCKDRASVVAIALDGDEIAGWTHVYTGFPIMMFIGRWYPVVRVGVDSEPIVLGLIEKTKDIILNHEHTRLEIELDRITEVTEPEMKTYAGWYSQCGFKLAATEVHMRADVSRVEVAAAPRGYSIQYLCGVRNADIEPAFYECFDNDQDELYLSLDRPQRAVTFCYFFDRRRPMVDEASLAIFWKDRVVGFVVVREDDGVADIGPVGIVPEHQGKGLSKALMSRSINGLQKEGIRVTTLDASASNMRARNLYEKYGFAVQYLKAFLVWKKQP